MVGRGGSSSGSGCISGGMNFRNSACISDGSVGDCISDAVFVLEVDDLTFVRFTAKFLMVC